MSSDLTITNDKANKLIIIKNWDIKLNNVSDHNTIIFGKNIRETSEHFLGKWQAYINTRIQCFGKDNITIREIIEKNKLQDIIEYIIDTNRLNRKTEDWNKSIEIKQRNSINIGHRVWQKRGASLSCIVTLLIRITSISYVYLLIRLYQSYRLGYSVSAPPVDGWEGLLWLKTR